MPLRSPVPKGLHLWVILLVLVVMTAAGGAYALTRGDDDTPVDSIRIALRSDAGADPVFTILNCDDVDAARVCEAITPALLKPVGAREVCTMVYGGPQTLRITGRLRGQEVDVNFSRTDGCQIDRWNRLAKVLKPLGIKGLEG